LDRVLATRSSQLRVRVSHIAGYHVVKEPELVVAVLPVDSHAR
jgi:hypothetical protein